VAEIMSRIYNSIFYFIGLSCLAAFGFAWSLIAEGTEEPTISITNPTNDVVAMPLIQIKGSYPDSIQAITFDISNSTGVSTSQGYVTGQIVDQAKWNRITSEMSASARSFDPSKMEELNKKLVELMDHPVNRFELDANMVTGVNLVTIHLKDGGGKLHIIQHSYKLDYTNKKPPKIQWIYPQEQEAIGGDDFTLEAQIDDYTASVEIMIQDSNNHVFITNAIVEMSGKVWGNHLPIWHGTNEVNLIVTDATGNISTNTISVSRGAFTVTMQPLRPDQLNKQWVDVRGTISDTNCIVEVNGVKGTTHADGTWDALHVLVSPAGVAEFDIKVIKN
jgi:hypothetical protein